MTFLVQFKRFRRGVPEVIGTLPIAAADGAAALAFARSLAGMRRWPTRTDALRVMDDGGRTLLDWTVPAATAQPVTYSPTSVPAKPTGDEPARRSANSGEHPEESRSTPASGSTSLLWDRRSPTRRMVSPRPGKAAMRSSGSMIRIMSRNMRSEAQISRMTGSSMSTNSARTWARASAAAELTLRFASRPVKNLHQAAGEHGEPEPLAAKGKRARHGPGHPQFGEIDHAQDLGCVDTWPQLPPRNHDHSSTEGGATETTTSNYPTEVCGHGLGVGLLINVSRRWAKLQEAERSSDSSCGCDIRDPVRVDLSRYRRALRGKGYTIAPGAASFRGGYFPAHCGYIPSHAELRQYPGATPRSSEQSAGSVPASRCA